MRFLIIPILVVAAAFSFGSCGSSSSKTFCDTTCNNDTLRFTIEHPDHPFVYISVKNCAPDSITWGNDMMLNNRKMKFSDMTGEELKLNKNFVRSYIKDTSYAWILFNDCINGQGYAIKIPYNKGNISPKNNAINSLDPKYSVAENLVAYTDRGNVFVEDMETGKKAMMTFGKRTDLDYNAMHETIDSVNITPTKVWVKIKIDGAWKELNKDITLE